MRSHPLFICLGLGFKLATRHARASSTRLLSSGRGLCVRCDYNRGSLECEPTVRLLVNVYGKGNLAFGAPRLAPLARGAALGLSSSKAFEIGYAFRVSGARGDALSD